MFFNKLDLYYNTLKHVKPTQLYHQVYYRIKNRFFESTYKQTPAKVPRLNFSPGILYSNSWLGNNTFSFLNLEKEFEEIDWNYSEYGKLWTYNLNYFEFLNQENISKEQGETLIQEYLLNKPNLRDGLEPYPISLRGINWIKFLSREKINHHEINNFLYQDYLRLVDNLEHHLLANHLLENGFSLLFGAYYFEDDNLYSKASTILIKELKEQILKDGAHYELSPMYHQIILHRVLDCYNLVANNSWKNKELLPLLKNNAEKMLGWLNEITFQDGEIPKLNDSTTGIAPTTKQMQVYAAALGLNPVENKLSASGYRKFKNQFFEILMDVGQIAPSYQPGHSHADSLEFLLNYRGKPIIVETGISTYDKNERRQLERSTPSHNTVTINEGNSSNVWGGFRVAERAKVEITKDTAQRIEAKHDGYRSISVSHKRKFSILSEIFRVEDEISPSSGEDNVAKGHLHFHPDISFILNKDQIIINDNLLLNLSGAEAVEIRDYQYAEGFNKLVPGKKIVYQFKDEVVITFEPLVLDTIFTSAKAEGKNH